jgi:hypothetical protein
LDIGSTPTGLNADLINQPPRLRLKFGSLPNRPLLFGLSSSQKWKITARTLRENQTADSSS